MERPRIPDYETEKEFDFQYVWGLNRYIEILERKIYIFSVLKNVSVTELPYCGCIDKCGSKHREYFCKTKRYCKDKYN